MNIPKWSDTGVRGRPPVVGRVMGMELGPWLEAGAGGGSQRGAAVALRVYLEGQGMKASHSTCLRVVGALVEDGRLKWEQRGKSWVVSVVRKEGV